MNCRPCFLAVFAMLCAAHAASAAEPTRASPLTIDTVMTKQEQQAIGVNRMTQTQKTALTRWINKFAIQATTTARGPAFPASSVPQPSDAVVQSVIVSEFDGLDHGKIFELQNGQIWKQTEYWIWVWVWVRPTVTVYRDGAVYKMKVQNIDRAVTVERIK